MHRAQRRFFASDRKPNRPRHLAALATKPGEIYGLANCYLCLRSADEIRRFCTQRGYHLRWCRPLEGMCQQSVVFPSSRAIQRGALGRGCNSHPAVFPTRPDLHLNSCRVLPAPATHQVQGGGTSKGMIPAPGAVRRPRKSSSSAGRVHAIEDITGSGLPRRVPTPLGSRPTRRSIAECVRPRRVHPGL